MHNIQLHQRLHMIEATVQLCIDCDTRIKRGSTRCVACDLIYRAVRNKQNYLVVAPPAPDSRPKCYICQAPVYAARTVCQAHRSQPDRHTGDHSATLVRDTHKYSCPVCKYSDVKIILRGEGGVMLQCPRCIAYCECWYEGLQLHASILFPAWQRAMGDKVNPWYTKWLERKEAA